MSVEDAPQCEYCNRFGHSQGECSEARSDRRWEGACCWLGVFCMTPFALIGALCGLLVSGFLAGFRVSIGAWTAVWGSLFPRQKGPK